MDRKRNRYKDMERSVTMVLLADLLLFIFYLIAAANGILWLKITLFILSIVLSVLCLLFLYYTGELVKQRSLWMTTAFAAIAICLIFSLILNYPSPNPYLDNAPKSTVSATETT